MSDTQQPSIVRTFIAQDCPEALLAPRTPLLIRQGYLSQQADKQIRLRDQSGSFSMRVSQGSGSMRQQCEIALDPLQFASLWPLTEGARLQKQRYHIPYFGLNLQIDVFGGALTPLILLKVDFECEEVSRCFSPPDFVMREVTNNPAYSNLHLACYGLPS